VGNGEGVKGGRKPEKKTEMESEKEKHKEQPSSCQYKRRGRSGIRVSPFSQVKEPKAAKGVLHCTVQMSQETRDKRPQIVGCGEN